MRAATLQELLREQPEECDREELRNINKTKELVVDDNASDVDITASNDRTWKCQTYLF